LCKCSVYILICFYFRPCYGIGKYDIFGDKTMISEKLQKIGLNDKEARIYTSLLELGETNVQRLSKKSKIKRTTIYNVIDSLKDRGLVSTVLKNKRKYYVASDPRELEFKLEAQKLALKNLMPELLSITNLIDKKPKIKYFEGEEGLKEIYLDTLNYPDRPLWAWVTGEIFQVLDDSFVQSYLDNRVKKEILAYVIAPKNKILEQYKSQDNKYLRQTRLETNPDYSIEVEIDLYGGNKIGIMAFKEKIGLIVESQKIYNTLKSIFDVSWNNLR